MIERLVPGDPAWKEFSAPHLARYLFAADYACDRRVLDAGTGSGYGARLLRSTGATLVVGIDIDPDRYWRTWKQVADLAAPSVSDYPIVALPVATLFGATAFHIAICRKPRSQME